MPPDVDSIRTQLRSTLLRLSNGRAFADDTDVFAERVVSSINLLELIVYLEDTYRFEVTQQDVFAGELRSLDRLVALVSTRAAGGS